MQFAVPNMVVPFPARNVQPASLFFDSDQNHFSEGSGAAAENDASIQTVEINDSFYKEKRGNVSKIPKAAV